MAATGNSSPNEQPRHAFVLFEAFSGTVRLRGESPRKRSSLPKPCRVLIRLKGMSEELAEVDFQRFWRRLQQLGLNAYESRSYLVLLGHPRFKALELAARAHVPRQKIYEVLDSLVEKGFAQVVQEKTKLFSAVEPSLAVPGFLTRKRQAMEQDLTENSRAGSALIDDLSAP